MVRFSCFQAHHPSRRQKKTVHMSSEAMQKARDDSFQNQALSSISCLKSNITTGLNGEGGTQNKIADCMLDYFPSERDCKSDEIDGKYGSDCDSVLHKNAAIKKSQSLSSVLNWEERTFGADGSEDDMEHRFSYDGSANRSGIAVADGIDLNVLALSDQCLGPMPSDSVQVGSDVTKNVSIFSIGDPELIEKEVADKDDIGSSGIVDSANASPHIRPVIAKSNSLPRISSPNQCSVSLLPHSKSSEDLSTFSSRKTSMMHEVGRQMQFEERDTSVFHYDKNGAENPADEADENYNYVGEAKDWIVPCSDGANMEKYMGRDASYSYWGEDFKLKRIEHWVTNLQYSGPLEESDECGPSYVQQELSTGNTLLVEPTARKLEVKVTPGMEAAKRYISAMNPSATAAQLTNLGLVVIPFLSAFVSIKALNLSGNAIVRIAAGALPRGLHILNLSRNNISAIEGLRDLTRLRVLDLSYNRILRIGHGLAGCSSLKELYLAGNKISEVEGLHRLLKLNVLDLRFNKISTSKCLGQLAANYNCLHALSLEGNPAQKNVGDEALKKYVLSLLPNLTYYNRQPIKVGTMKDGADRSARLGIGSHQIERSLRAEMKNMRKGTHGIVAQKVSSSSTHGRKGQVAPSVKATSSSRHGRRPPSGMRTAGAEHQYSGLRNDFSVHRSRSEGNLGVL